MTVEKLVATDLCNKFIEEQEYIQEYVYLVQSQLAVHESDIRDIKSTLSKYDIQSEFETNRNWNLWKKPYSIEDLQNSYNELASTSPQIVASIEITEQELANINRPPAKDQSLLHPEAPVGACLQFMIDAIEYDMSPENIEASRNELARQIKETGLDQDPFYSEDAIDFATGETQFILTYKKLQELQSALNQINKLDLVIRTATPSSEINALRQGFITLMTIFDATIFDLMRIALKEDFFQLIGVFGKNTKISLGNLAEYTSFESFRDDIIESELKSKYLKEILVILENQGVTCIDKKTGAKFIQLIEMILRRNIHVHNKGRVDERYMEKNKNGKPLYNIHNFELGELAHINSGYWESANRLCKNCVISVADWVSTLPVHQTSSTEV